MIASLIITSALCILLAVALLLQRLELVRLRREYLRLASLAPREATMLRVMRGAP